MADADTELPLELKIELLQSEIDQLRSANQAQEEALNSLKVSDAKQWEKLRLQQKVQAGSALAFLISLLIGFAGFSAESRKTLESAAVLMVVSLTGVAGAPLVTSIKGEKDEVVVH